jgi:hypothetical protein
LFKFQKEIKQNNMAFTTVKNAFKKNPEIAPDNYYNSLKYRIECGKRNAGINKDIYQKILKHTTQEKIQDYISKNNIGSDTYGDYLRACDWLRLDFSDTKVLFPKDFFKWHDDYTQQYAEYVAQKEKEAKTQLSESLKKVAMKYSFVEKNLCGFFVIVAKSKEDLIYEGELLKHCVGKMGYDKKQANEESLICFIRKDKKTPFVTCELDLKTMKIRGLGGTDFRPVFEYVETLRQNKEFTNLKGLIYFTDGDGAFPAKKPDYDTAFVFVDDEYNNPDVPPWAIKLILQKDEI